jgi:glc operon protein GlcG
VNIKKLISLSASIALCAVINVAHAQVPQYGANINQVQTQKALAGALAEAQKINVPMAITVVDTGGHLIGFVRSDNTQIGSIAVSQDKANTAALYRRSSKVFQGILAAGGDGLRVLTLRGVTAVEGGLPIMMDGKIIGAIGVSGGSAEQDGVVAKAGLDALAAK